MKERPILFSAPMVRAILDGRKTQTRRVLKPYRNHPIVNLAEAEPSLGYSGKHNDYRGASVPADERAETELVYAATDIDYVRNLEDDEGFSWRPSIHMPRWASRITLEVTGVRVERLQDISETDAIAEGCAAIPGAKWHTFEEADAGIPMHDHTARDAFEALWDSINGEGSSDANPWVWVVEFRRIEQETTRAA